MSHIESLTNFYLTYSDDFYGNPLIRNKFLSQRQFFDYTESSDQRNIFEKILNHYLQEAEWTLSLIKGLHFDKTSKLLEVGGGHGFVYGFFKKQGFDIYSLEPSDSGFDDSWHIALEIFKIIEVDPVNYLNLSAENASSLQIKFDIIFSNNVFEHILDTDKALDSLNKVMADGGLMIHNTVNYLVPYEPHFKMILFPFWPRLTAFFRPSLKKSDLWQGLNFITTTKLKNICKKYGLDIEFKKGVLLDAFTRLDTDPEFAQRQKYLVPIYNFFKKIKILQILNKVPASLVTPIVFICRHSQPSAKG